METSWLKSHPGIRVATADDLERILEIERLCFDPPWSRNQFLASFKGLFFVIEEAEEILGFLVGCTCEIARRAIIMRIAVHPGHRHRGLATRLITAALEEFRQMAMNTVELDVDIVKNGAIKLYEKFGFKIMQVATVDHEDEPSYFMMKLSLRNEDS
jgi:ribosomal-protein-alanine N-acetyltransferase